MIHTPHNNTPPRELPAVIILLKRTYAVWLIRFRDFPKVERYGIGNKIEQAFLETLELVLCLSYLPPEQKIPFLNKAITKLDILKFFLQIVWENKLLTTQHYTEISTQFEEVGRQLGAWKKGLAAKMTTKTPHTQ